MLHHNLLLSTAWDGSSVWDLPIDSMAQAPTIEQMQQYEKAKTAKVNTKKKKDKIHTVFLRTVILSYNLTACNLLVFFFYAFMTK